MMGADEIKSCYLGPAISPEQFISEHFFLYLAKGSITGYDGHKRYHLEAGEYCLVCKNHLARYSKEKDNNEFEKVVIIFDEHFLKAFQQKYPVKTNGAKQDSAFVLLNKNPLIPRFIRSLMPYYNGAGQIDDNFSTIKREELLPLLLKTNPGLENILFDFGIPQKIDIEAFMNKNYKFNASIQRFAYLTGRSLSAFKRDFKQIFNDTPGHWLIQRRLKEAYFLLDKKGERPSDIYLEVGFEDLSHFSYAFKKQFGISPARLKRL